MSSLSQVFLSVISLFFCGHIGPAELDAVSLANTVCHKLLSDNLPNWNLIEMNLFKLINIFALTSAYGFSSACDTLFPQVIYL